MNGGRRTLLIAAALIAVGFCFRVWAVDYARFTGDESYFWATARNVATFQARPVYGPPLTGSSAYHPGPIFYYLMSLPQFLGSSPRLGGIFVALLHALSGALFFLLMVRAKSERAGLIGLALLAFAPWDVLYADRVWLSCVAPVWGMLAIYAASRASASKLWQGALVFFALVCPQLHMSAPIVWIACAVLLFFDPPQRIEKLAVAAGLLCVLLAYALPIHWELTHDFTNTRAILEKGTGQLDSAGKLAAPFRVFGYAILYGTSEIGYHFARGYWVVPFSELHYYASAEGVRDYLRVHGPIFTAGNVFTVLVAFVSWIYAVVHLVRGWRRARALGSVRRNLELGDRLTLGLLLALAAAAVLMVAARKEYFPHYTNLLMPLALWPLVLALDSRGRRLAPVIAGLTAAFMVFSAARYYRNIDSLNGLGPTLDMVDRAMQDLQHGPIALQFEGFQNGFAWQMISDVKYHKALELRGDARVRYRVRNAAPHQGPSPANGEVFGPVLLERTQLSP